MGLVEEEEEEEEDGGEGNISGNTIGLRAKMCIGLELDTMLSR